MMKRFVGIGISLLVIGAVVVVWYVESRPSAGPKDPTQTITQVVDRGISPEDLPIFEQRVVDLQTELEEKQAAGEPVIGIYLRLGNAYYGLGQLGKAVEAYNEILKTHPKDGAALENKAQALSEMGDGEGAKVAWYAALAIDPREDTYLKLVTYLSSKEPTSSGEEVIRLLEEAVQNNGQTPGLMVALGNAYRREGNFQQAVTYYELAVQLSPDDASIQEELAAIRNEWSKQPSGH